MRHLALLLAFVLVLGCGGGLTDTQVQVQNRITIEWGGQDESDDVDFSDPRLLAALREASDLVGRELVFRFDVSMMPRPAAPFFNRFFEQEVGRIPIEIEGLQRRASVFAYLRAAFSVVYIGYNGAADRPESTYDDATGELRIILNGGSYPRGALRGAVDQGYEQYLARRFSGSTVANLSDDVLPEYVDWLTGPGGRQRRPWALLRLFEIWERVGATSAPVAQTVRDAIADRRSVVTRRYTQRRSGPPEREVLEAEQAFGRWLMADFLALSTESKVAILNDLFPRERGVRVGTGDRYRRDAFPGADRFELVAQLLSSWVAAGHPRDEELYIKGFCPNRPEQRNYENPRCRDAHFWGFVADDATLHPRLIERLLQQNDVELTETVFWNLIRDGNMDAVFAIWHALEDVPAHWQVGARVIGDMLSYRSSRDVRRQLYDEAVAAWRRKPALRAGYLYILAANEYPRSGSSGLVDFGAFRRVFGSTVSDDVFEQYLALGEGALVRLPAVWPALANGAAAVRIVDQRFNAFFDDREIYGRNGYRRLRSFPDLLAAMRDAGDRRALAAMATYLRGRLSDHPSEESEIEAYLTYTRR